MIQGDEREEIDTSDQKIAEKSDSESTETDDSENESEDSFNSTAQSPVSGSVSYFVAPLESSETQAMVIEELNQVRLCTTQYSQVLFFSSPMTFLQ